MATQREEQAMRPIRLGMSFADRHTPKAQEASRRRRWGKVAPPVRRGASRLEPGGEGSKSIVPETCGGSRSSSCPRRHGRDAPWVWVLTLQWRGGDSEVGRSYTLAMPLRRRGHVLIVVDDLGLCDSRPGVG